MPFHLPFRSSVRQAQWWLLLLVALALVFSPAGSLPVAAQAEPAETDVTRTLLLPFLTAGPSRETLTVDSQTLGNPAAAAEAVKAAAGSTSDSSLLDPPAPGTGPRQTAPDEAKAATDAGPAVSDWTTLLREGFEDQFPSGLWRVVDDNGHTSGEVTWDDDDYRAYSGDWSAWAANGGDDWLDPQFYRYANNMAAWMIYGPINLSQASAATLSFAYRNQSERDYDWFGWYASADGVSFHGWHVSGDSGGWRTRTLDLANVPKIGNLTGDSSVWIAFVFRSDGNTVDTGPFVDDVLIQQQTGDQGCSQARAEYFANRDLSGTPALVRCESWPLAHNWGTGSPAAGLPGDNFSARWTDTISLGAGRYQFSATADDGVRVWLDNSLIIDGWQEQGLTTYTATRQLAGGSHTLRVEYFERSGGAQLRFSWSLLSDNCPTITEWRGEYWNNETLSGTPVRCRNDAKLDFDWGAGSPAAEVDADHFSARWTRTLSFNAGRYRFHLAGDDGVRLWVDDVLLIDEWREQAATEFSAVRELAAGSHTLRVEYFEDSNDASVKLWWELAPDRAIIFSDRPAFDTCYLPAPYQMAAWWQSSPYDEVNLYIGGANRGCEEHNRETLTAQWVNMVSSQGWNFIPTWVGPQAPCTNFRARMSWDAGVAYQQGRDEAEAAARAAQSFGLTASGLGGTIIYYDVESYGDNPECRAAVNSFIDGWTGRLHELGNRAGAYGAACSSHVSDWASLDNVPDDIWPAHWIWPAYRPDVSVWDVACIDNTVWTDHQRIRQYAGDHSETYAGITLVIDSNIADGHVAGENPRPGAGQAAAAQATALPVTLHDLGLLPGGTGWALAGDRLLRSENAGATWRDITPADAAGMTLRAATFVDPAHGWLVLAGAPDAQNRARLHVAATQDGGQSWQIMPLTGFDPLDPNSTQGPVQLSFVDDQTGWLAIRLASSVNFSQAALFATVDGGRTWTPSTLPSAGRLRFVNRTHGWLAGGAAKETLYATADGGQSWQPVTLTLTLQDHAALVTYDLPTFFAGGTGVLPVTVSEGETSRVELLRTADAGVSWTPAATIPISGTAAAVQLLSAERWLVADAASGRLHTLAVDGQTVQVESTDLLLGVEQIAFADAELGWAKVAATTCLGDKTGQAAGDPFRCTWQRALVRTVDSGLTWSEITPPLN